MRRALNRIRNEDGFSLIEVGVALAVMFVALLALAQAALVGYRDVALARQRQGAAEVANQVLEQVRGIPYETLKKGLSSADLTGDSNIVACSGTYYFRDCPPTAGAEKLVHSSGLSNVTPLVPHVGTYGPPDYPNTYTWRVYVTEASDVGAAGAYRVWAIVEWTNAARAGVRNEVESQSLVYAPEGCQDTATHPFGAPCQAFHLGSATISQGGTVTSGPLDGADYESMGLELLAETTSTQVEQITRVEGTLSLPGGRSTVAGVATTAGRAGTATQADTDPATPGDDYESDSVPLQSPGVVTVLGTGGTLSVNVGGSDLGSSISAVAAGGSTPCNSQADGRPCGFGTGTQAGALTHTYALPSDGGTATLVQVATSSTPNTVYARREVPVAGSDGLVRATVVRNIPEVRIGGLPAGATPPTGWNGYLIKLTGYSATAQAESGTNTTAPSTSVAGTVEYWNGTGYTTTVVDAAGASLPLGSVDAPVTGTLFGTGRVLISGTAEIRASSTSEMVGSPTTTRTEAVAEAGAPLVGELSYRVEQGGVVIADLTIVVNLGDSTATTTYQPAPTV